ncbi:UNVERIFIED_CONTAM: hypothetical protein FKN15_003305 [Acipenser sinensis]
MNRMVKTQSEQFSHTSENRTENFGCKTDEYKENVTQAYLWTHDPTNKKVTKWSYLVTSCSLEQQLSLYNVSSVRSQCNTVCPVNPTINTTEININTPNQTILETKPPGYVNPGGLNVSGLTQGTTYNVTFNISSVLCYKYITTKPDIISSLSVTSVSTTSISLSWTKPQGNSTSYRVQVQGTGLDRNLTANSESITVTDLTAGSLYSFSVTARAADNLTEGDTVTITKHTKPDIISSLSVTSVSTTSISLSWTKPQGNSTSYRVQVQGAGLDRNLTANSESITVTDLTAGSVYTFSVTARAADNLTEGDTVTITKHTKPDIISSLSVTSVSTTSISLSWTKPQGNSTSYRVLVQGTGLDRNLTANSESITVTDLTAGSLYTFSVTARAADNLTEGDTVTITKHTKPDIISNLSVTSVSTTSISLSWTKPQGNSTSYRVLVQGTGLDRNLTANSESITVTDLTAGSLYTFSVTARAADNLTEGDTVTITKHTKPEKISAIILVSSEPKNSSMLVNWSAPAGNVETYEVNINSSFGDGQTKNITTKPTSVQFDGLRAGRIYSATVTTISGPFREQSGVVQNATYPNAPGSISSDSKTTSSISLSWGSPVSMDPNSFNFSVTYSSNAFDSKILVTTSTSVQLFNLQSGTLYSMSVVTNGVMGFQSAAVTQSTSTRPNTVQDLNANSISTTSIELKWGKPQDYKTGYKYRVQTPNISGGVGFNKVVNSETATVSPLEAGTQYNLTVTTLTSDDTDGTSSSIILYTRPTTVTNLMAGALNSTAVNLTWARPADFKPGYSYRLQTTGPAAPQNVTVNVENAIITGLTPGTNFSFSAFTRAADSTTEGDPATTTSYTNPNAPGSISSDSKTTSSISLSWGSPVSMDPNSFNFSVTYSSNAFDSKILVTTSTSVQLFNLQSGTLYSMSVVTNGVMGFQSAAVTQSTSTRPNTVQDLNANSISTTSIELKWGKPQDYKTGYKYRVQTPNISGGVGFNKVVNSETATVSPLEAGTQYNLTVTTLTSDDTDGTSSSIILYTRPTTVTNLMAGALNSTAVNLTWARPADFKPGYSYRLQTTGPAAPQNVTVNVENAIITGLTPGTNFSFSAFTRAADSTTEGDPATTTSYTTFTAFLQYNTIQDYISIASFISHPVKVEDYETYYKKQHADSDCGIAEEFEDLRPIGINQTKNAALAPDNKAKNRYNNVLPYDSSRVKLSIRNSASDDYINANYIPGYDSTKQFIAAQGPLPGTVNDFWRMIWEQNVYTLVMLTRCNEQGRVKCEEYWPSSNSKTYGDVMVILASEIPLNEWTIREFKMKNPSTFFHYLQWFPASGRSKSQRITSKIMELHPPIVLKHESATQHTTQHINKHNIAGVGRTGTLIAIDRLIYQIERESVVDIYGIVHNLRMHRPLMVQTEDQYIFLNQCAKDFIRSRTGNNVDLIYQNTAAMGIYENFTPTKTQNGHHC